MAEFRGLDSKHEHGASEMARDTRPLGVRIALFLGNPLYAACIIASCVATMVVYPAAADIVALLAFFEFIYSYTRKVTLPCKMPQTSGLDDYNDTLPGTTKPRKGRGITFFGNEKGENKEIWFSNDDMRTHVLLSLIHI